MVKPHHFVKWTAKSEIHYGCVIPPFFGEARMHAANGKLLVDHAIKPIVQFVVDEQEVVDVDPDECFCYMRQSRDEAQRLSDALGDRLKAGKMLSNTQRKSKFTETE